MQRKVIQQGPSTLMVSLPSVWVKKNNITKGRVVEVTIQDNALVVSSGAASVKKKTMMTIASSEQYMRRLIISKYREGYEEIVIQYKDHKVLDLIRETLQYLLGFEIVNQTDSSCTISNVAEGLKDNYDQMFHRQFQIVLTLGEMMKEYFKTDDMQVLHKMVDFRHTLSKVQEYCLRLLTREDFFTEQHKQRAFFSVWNIGVIGKMWIYLARHLLSLKKNQLGQKERVYEEKALQYVRLLYDLHFNYKNELLVEIKNKRVSLIEEGQSLLHHSKEPVTCHYLLSIVEKVHDVSTAF